MILFCNVLITDAPYSRYDRGRFPDTSNADIFRYFLASMSVIPWEAVYVFCGLEGCHATEDTRNQITSSFEEAFAHVQDKSLTSRRLITLGAWRTALAPLLAKHRNSLIYYTGNHDHIFIDYDLDCLNACTSFVQFYRKQNPYLSIPYSHWLFEISDRSQCLLHSHYFTMSASQRRDAIQILTPELMHRWFFKESQHMDPASRVRRSEDLGGWLGAETFLRVVPNRELARHYDGDSHISISCFDYPPLHIPSGFFERNLRIATYPVGGRDYAALEQEGYTVLDPSCRDLAISKAGGVYARQCVQDIPLFWRSRIASIETKPDEDQGKLLRQRDDAALDVVHLRYSADLQTAKALFPPAFRMPQQDWDGVARNIPPKAMDRTSRCLEFRHEIARSYKVSRAVDAEITIILHDRLPVPALSDAYADDLARLARDHKVEFIYVCLLEDTQARWITPFSVSTLVRLDHHDLVDEVIHYQYDCAPDKLQALKCALARSHGKLAVAMEMTHGAERLRFRPFVEEALASLRSSAPPSDAQPAALASPTSVLKQGVAHHDPEQLSAMAFWRDPVFKLLTSHDEYIGLDYLPLAKTLEEIFKAHRLPVGIADSSKCLTFYGQHLGPKLVPLRITS